MSRKRPKKEKVKVDVESRLRTSSTELIPRTFRALSFEEICAQAECDGHFADFQRPVPVPVEMNNENGNSQNSPMHFGSPLFVIPSFDDICALHGISNTTQLENVEFTDLLRNESQSTTIDNKVPSHISKKSYQLKDVKESCKQYCGNFQYYKVTNSLKVKKLSTQEQEFTEDNEHKIGVAVSHGKSGATLKNAGMSSQHADTEQNPPMKEKCRKIRSHPRLTITIKDRKVTEISEIDVGLPANDQTSSCLFTNKKRHKESREDQADPTNTDCKSSEIVVMPSDKESDESESDKRVSHWPEIHTLPGPSIDINLVPTTPSSRKGEGTKFVNTSRSVCPNSRHASTARSSGKEEGAKLDSTPTGTDISARIIPASTSPESGKIEVAKLANSQIALERKQTNKRKFSSGQKLESICQKLMKMKDEESGSSSPPEESEPQQTSFHISHLEEATNSSRPSSYKSGSNEGSSDSNQRTNDDAELQDSQHAFNEVTAEGNPHETREDEEEVSSPPEELLCDLFSSGSFHSIAPDDELEW